MSSNTAYSVVLTLFWIIPTFNLNNSIKFESSVLVKVFLASVKSILNLWAPGAFWLEAPAALSFRDKSSFGVTKDSVTARPTL